MKIKHMYQTGGNQMTVCGKGGNIPEITNMKSIVTCQKCIKLMRDITNSCYGNSNLVKAI